MKALKAVRYLLANNMPLLAVVPATRIITGTIPQGTAMPAIGVSRVSRVQENLASGETGLRTTRAQVTAIVNKSIADGGDIPALDTLLNLIRAAVPRSRGTVNGVNVDSILPEIEVGPFDSEDGLRVIAVIDYIVKFTE